MKNQELINSTMESLMLIREDLDAEAIEDHKTTEEVTKIREQIVIISNAIRVLVNL